MNEDELRTLLADVQAGRLSPDDAAARLSTEDGGPPTEIPAAGVPCDVADGPAVDPDDVAIPHDVTGVRLVQIRATAAGVRVIGRPGLHELRV